MTYFKFLRARKKWLNTPYPVTTRTRAIDRHWYYWGARKRGTVRFSRSRKPWKEWA